MNGAITLDPEHKFVARRPAGAEGFRSAGRQDGRTYVIDESQNGLLVRGDEQLK